MRKKNCRKMKISNSRRNGFTLIELVIAITIFSLIAVIIGGAFRLGIQAWQKGEKEANDAQQLRILSSLLSQQLKSCYPYKMKIPGRDEDIVVFRGDADSIMFVTTLADSAFGGVKWVQYVFKDATLSYKEGLLPDNELEKKIKDKGEIIDSKIDELQFSYLSPDEEQWQETWDFGEELPVAIKVRVSSYEPFVINIPVSAEAEDNENDDELPSET